MKIFILIMCLFNVSCSLNNQTKIEVRRIIPPQLNEAYLGKKIICNRPARIGAPLMNLEHHDNKIIVNNYGFGAGGWTLGPGAAAYSISLLEDERVKAGFSKDKAITVIGGGVIGLFSALELIDKGYTNITIVASSFDNLTSHNAGGLLSPLSMDVTADMRVFISKLCIDAYKFYHDIALNKHSYLNGGAIKLSAYFDSARESGLEDYVGIVMQPAKNVTLDFGNGTTRNMLAYDDAIFMDTAKLMQLLSSALQNKVKFKQHHVKNFNEIKDDIIINCSGAGAKELSKDDKVIPIQGHLIMLKNQHPQADKYMVSVHCDDNGTTASGQHVKRKFYFYPKYNLGSPVNDVGVIGGTFIKGADESTPNLAEFEIIVNQAKNFYGL